MVSNFKTLRFINTYYVVTQLLTLASTPTKVLKKQRKIRGRGKLATINRAQSDTTDFARFIYTALNSVSQAITHAHTNKIVIYKNKDTVLCADSGAS